MITFRLAAVLCGCALAAAAQVHGVPVPAGPSSGRTLIWIMQQDTNTLAAYDAADFRKWFTMPLPPEAKGHPESISISSYGAVLVAYPVGEGVSLRRFWQSDPRLSPLTGGADERTPAPGGGYLITTAVPQVYFSTDPERLFWFENRKRVSTRGGPEISVNTVFLAWTTDREGQDVRPVAEVPFPECKCETGACEESCPEAMVWAPGAGVTDFLFMTRWVPGQLGPQFLQTDLYRLQNGQWGSRKLPAPVEQVADAADHGDVFLEIVNDGGCCGWENDSNDELLLHRNGQSAAIYDERARFHNDNYDVSFVTERARISPDGTRVAYTLASTARPGAEIRLSSSGKTNPEELQRVKNAIGELPRTEVLALADPKRIAAGVYGELVGWLDSTRILIVEAGELVVFDPGTGAKTPTQIKATSAREVFVR